MTQASLGPLPRVLMLVFGALSIGLSELLYLRLYASGASLPGVMAAVAIPATIGVVLGYYGFRG